MSYKLALLLMPPLVWHTTALEQNFTVKIVANSRPPQSLSESVRPLLSDRAIQLYDGNSELVAEFWFRKLLPATATEDQIANGLTYHEIAESTLLGSVRIAKPFTDYRKQKIAPGVYLLRLAFQPVSDDHNGTAPHPEFCLLTPAAVDRSPDTMPAKALHQLSKKSTNVHPAVLLLLPGQSSDEPKLIQKEGGHQVLLLNLAMDADGKKAAMAFALTVHGCSPAI